MPLPRVMQIARRAFGHIGLAVLAAVLVVVPLASSPQSPDPHWASKIAAVDFATGGVLSPPVDAHAKRPDGDLFPGEWSPDGSALIYSLDSETPGPRPVFIRDTATGLLRELRTSLVGLQRPLWAPDGTSFAVRGSTNASPPCCGLHLIDARSGAGRRFVDRAELLLAWSRDGSRVYFYRMAADGSLETELVEHTITSGAERIVHRWRGGESVRLGIAMSPDAETVYYRNPGRAAAPAHRLLAKDVATGKERELLRSRPIGSLTVSPSGRFVVTSSEGTPLLVPTSGGAPRPVPSAAGHVPTILAWGPDDQSFLGRVTTTDDQGRARASYWWVPLGAGNRLARKIEWNVGPDAYGFRARGHWIAFVERIGPADPSLGAGVIQSPARQ